MLKLKLFTPYYNAKTYENLRKTYFACVFKEFVMKIERSMNLSEHKFLKFIIKVNVCSLKRNIEVLKEFEYYFTMNMKSSCQQYCHSNVCSSRTKTILSTTAILHMATPIVCFNELPRLLDIMDCHGVALLNKNETI